MAKLGGRYVCQTQGDDQAQFERHSGAPDKPVQNVRLTLRRSQRMFPTGRLRSETEVIRGHDVRVFPLRRSDYRSADGNDGENQHNQATGD